MGITEGTVENMVIMANDFLKDNYGGKKVLITGHTGFKGSWLLVWLRQLGAEVTGFALAPEQQRDLYNLLDGDALCTSIIADVRNAESINAAVTGFRPDYIFHMAAQPLVRRSYEIPVDTFGVNVMGTINLLEAVRLLDKECSVVVITTDKVYENKEWHYPYRETDHLGGYDPYSASKAAAEIVVGSYRNSFFNPANFNVHGKAIASARAGNVIGGGDRARDRIIPDLVNALEKNETLVLRNPEAVRPWQHVIEPLHGYLLLGARLKGAPGKYGGAWNFGPNNDDTLTVKELVNKAFIVWGKEGCYINSEVKEAPHEASLLKLDISKAIAQLGWRPKLNSLQAIEKTLEWYKAASTGIALALTETQILNYNKLV